MQSNLLKRVITASIIFPFVISIILYQNDLIVRLFLNIVIFLAAFELSRLCFTENAGNRRSFIFITIVFISIFLSNLIVKNNIWGFQIIFSIILWLTIFLYIIKLEKVSNVSNFGIVYAFNFAILLSCMYSSVYTLYILSPNFLIYLICLISLVDISAYFFGKIYGKTPFFQIISPNKTREGFYGSLVTCMIFSTSFCIYQKYELDFTMKLICISLLVAIASSFGDLSVSLIKRMSGKKDTGKILPGHGGLLDRIDSILPAAPIFLILSFSLSVII